MEKLFSRSFGSLFSPPRFAWRTNTCTPTRQNVCSYLREAKAVFLARSLFHRVGFLQEFEKMPNCKISWRLLFLDRPTARHLGRSVCPSAAVTEASLWVWDQDCALDTSLNRVLLHFSLNLDCSFDPISHISAVSRIVGLLLWLGDFLFFVEVLGGHPPPIMTDAVFCAIS